MKYCYCNHNWFVFRCRLWKRICCRRLWKVVFDAEICDCRKFKQKFNVEKKRKKLRDTHDQWKFLRMIHVEIYFCWKIMNRLLSRRNRNILMISVLFFNGFNMYYKVNFEFSRVWLSEQKNQKNQKIKKIIAKLIRFDFMRIELW